MAPSAASMGTPRRGSSSVTISQVAAAVRVDPVDRAEAGVGAVMVDDQDGHPREQVGMVAQRCVRPAAARRESPTTMRSYASSGSGSLRTASDVGHEVVHRGDRVAAREGHLLAQRTPAASASASADPSASASGSRWQTVRIRWAPSSRSTTACGHGREVGRGQRREAGSDRPRHVAARCPARAGGLCVCGRGRWRAAPARPRSGAGVGSASPLGRGAVSSAMLEVIEDAGARGCHARRSRRRAGAAPGCA